MWKLAEGLHNVSTTPKEQYNKHTRDNAFIKPYGLFIATALETTICVSCGSYPRTTRGRA
jgi:hypothetical protein